MRVYRRKEFLALPEGTIYAKGKPWYFDGLTVKADTTTDLGDWWSLNPCWVASETGEEVWSRLEKMLEEGASYPMEDAISRDGLHEADQLFLVFERADLEKLRGIVDTALGLTEEGGPR